MQNLPLPRELAEHFKPSATVNFSLLLDRGVDLEADKPEFLKAFVERFQNSPAPQLRQFLARRAEALKALNAASVDLYAQTRLVVGLGLPNPIETGFLLDRLTGCPFLPGSSVKGLLRSAARLVAAGELEMPVAEARSFWLGHLTRVFGPEIEAGVDPRRGGVVFYDAFPVTWPRLAVDVLTPHQSKYYQGEGVPADWNKPVPVPFLTVEKGIAYRFWLGPGDRARTSWPADLDQLRPLLTVALDLLGIGGKKAAGYGVFGTQKPTVPAAGSSQAGAAPSPNTAADTKEWKDVELRWHRGAPAAFRGNDTATGSEDVLPPDLLEALKSLKKKKGKLVGTVEVRKFLGTEWRIVAVTGWRLIDK